MSPAASGWRWPPAASVWRSKRSWCPIPRSSGSCAAPVRPSCASQARASRASWPCSAVGGRLLSWGLTAGYIRCGQPSSARPCAGTSKRHCWQKSTRCSTRLACRRGDAVGARAAILREQLGATWIAGCWRLRLSRGASLWRQARSGRLPHRLLALIGMHTRPVPPVAARLVGDRPGSPAGALRYR